MTRVALDHTIQHPQPMPDSPAQPALPPKGTTGVCKGAESRLDHHSVDFQPKSDQDPVRRVLVDASVRGHGGYHQWQTTSVQLPVGVTELVHVVMSNQPLAESRA